MFSSLQAAIDTETATEETIVPQAGTGPGIVVGPATLSPVDDFYMDYYVVNTDTTPSNGLASQWARVSSYDGATRTLTLDKPWDFSAESDVTLVLPARVWLIGDTDENIVIPNSIELNLEGHRIKGTVDITGGIFQWIRGAGGYITNGIQKTNFGLLRTDDATVSRRDDTLYAVLMTSGSDLGRCELKNCRLSGRAAGRRGRSGWIIKDCTNYGVPNNSNFDNVGFALVESVAGVAITLVQLDIDVDSDFSGAFLYTENNITGATAYFSASGVIRCPGYPFEVAGSQEPFPRNFAFVRAVGAGAMNVTVTQGNSQLSLMCFRNSPVPTNTDVSASILTAENATGTVIFNTNVNLRINLNESSTLYFIGIEGTSDMSGSLTLGGTSGFTVTAHDTTVDVVHLGSRVTGSVVVSHGSNVVIGGTWLFINYQANQNSGTPIITISSPFQVFVANSFRLINASGAIAISVGTYTISGLITGSVNSFTSSIAGTSVVSGGTWTFSFSINMMVFSSANAAAVMFANFQGSGGTVTYSGTIAIAKPDIRAGSCTYDLAVHQGSGGSVIISGTVTLQGMNFTGAARLVRATVSGGTATVSGTVNLRYSTWENASIFCNASAAGATVNGPATLNVEFCTFLSTLTTQSGAGTVTWTGATLRFRHCHIEGLYTVVYTAFTTHEAFHSRFNGGSGNKSIAGSGTRPTTLRYWACSFAQRYDDILPEVINVYDVLPAQAALVQGQPVFINGANQYQVCVAGSVVDGVLLAAAGAAATFAVCVRQGRVFVAVNAVVVNGSNLILDVATPTQATAGAAVVGQEIGTALQAAGTTIAGKAYSAVNVR